MGGCILLFSRHPATCVGYLKGQDSNVKAAQQALYHGHYATRLHARKYSAAMEKHDRSR